MHCVFPNFNTDSQPKMPIFNNHAYYSFTSLVLREIKVKEGNVIKPSHNKSALVRK